jgi:hypothetical protein
VQDEAGMVRTAGGKASGGGGALEAGEDGVEEGDGAAATEPRRLGRTVRRRRTARRWRSPRGRGGRGRSGRKPPAFRGPTVWRGVRASADFKKPAAAENPMGQRTGGATEGSGQGG